MLCSDIILAAEGARIGDGHARYALVPAGGATVRLAERISPSRAAQLFYTAALHDAETLRDWGLVNEVVPRERLMVRALELAREIAAQSPEAIKHIKALTSRRASREAREERMRAELEHFARHIDGADLARGLAAFRRNNPHATSGASLSADAARGVGRLAPLCEMRPASLQTSSTAIRSALSRARSAGGMRSSVMTR